MVKNSIINNFISLFLSFVITTSLIVGCGNTRASEYAVSEQAVQEYNISEDTTIDTQAIADIISDEIQKEVEQQTQAPVEISTNWEDYVGDIDTFVYGLMKSEYELIYDVFNARIDLSDGTSVYGLGYSDYTGVFETDDGKTYFPAGFISLIGEPSIPQSEQEEGLTIVNLDAEDECGFVLAYDIEPYYEHCVIWDQYLRYGINDQGAITYETKDYVKGECDENLGALYSYDERRYVFDPDVGEYKYISGESLYTEIDYNELEKEVNRILEEQDINFADVDVETSIHIAQEAVNTFLLSRQEEAFMGYKVEDLIAASAELDPRECIQITDEGMIIIDASRPTEDSPSAVTKWITGVAVGIAIVGCFALDVFCPALLPLSGAISSAAIEVFMEVVVSNHNISNINWAKVGVSAVSGAILAWCCPMLAASAAGGVVKVLGKTLSETAVMTLGKITGYSVLTLSNALVSGMTGAAFSAIDGGSAAEVFDAFKMGALIGGALTIGVSAVVAGAGAIGGKIVTNIKPNEWMQKAVEKGSELKKHQIHFSKNVEKVLVPKSIHQATEAAMMEIRIELCGGDTILANKITQLPSDNNVNFVLKDTDGNVIKKNDLLTKKGEGVLTLSDKCDPQIAKEWADKGIKEIKITNGDPQFAPFSEYTFRPEAGITSNRNTNMSEFRKELANKWTENNDLIPKMIKDELIKRDIPLDNFSGEELQEILSYLKLTFHEGTDGNVYLISRALHESISHYGGVALAKALEMIQIGSERFRDLIRTPAPSIMGTLVGEGVS